MPSSIDSGLKDLVWAEKESGVSVSAGEIADTVTDSPYDVDLRDATSLLLPDQLMFSFDISDAASGANMLVYVIFSEDGVENPPTLSDQNKRILVASITEAGTLGRSNISATPVLARYFRLAYQNDNSVGSVTIGSRYAKSYQQNYLP